MAIIGVSPTSTTQSFTTSSVLLLNTNPNRVTVLIYNDSDQNFAIKLGPSASLDDFTFILWANGEYNHAIPSYQDVITGIGVASGSGVIRITEFS